MKQPNVKDDPPGAIYLDTNILRKIPFQSASPEYNKIRTLIRKIKSLENIDIKIYIPEVVALEYADWITTEKIKDYNNYKKLIKVLNNFFKTEEFTFKEIYNIDEKISIAVDHFFERNALQKIGIAENISIRQLINMAIENRAPFQKAGTSTKGDKGFKDTIILYSIIEHMKSTCCNNAVFISEDNIFSDTNIKKTLSDDKLKLVVTVNFDGAANILSKHIRRVLGVLDDYYDEEGLEYLSFLYPRFKEISEFIISNFDYNNEEFIRINEQGLPLFSGSIKSLKITPLNNIKDAVYDYGYYCDENGYNKLDLPEDKSVHIVFKVPIQIDVCFEDNMTVKYLYDYNKPEILPQTQKEKIINEPLQPLKPVSRQLRIIKEVYLESKITYQWSDLEIIGISYPIPSMSQQ
jgi:hypothetical protein